MTSTAATIDVLLRANTAAYRAEMVNSARVTTQSLAAIRKDAAQTAVSIANLNKAAAGFLGFQAVASGVRALVDAQKAIQQIHYGLQGATGSAAAAEKAYGFVSQTAKDLGLNLEEAAKSFTRMSASAGANGIAMRDQQELFRQLSRSATVMHLSSDEMGRATTALGQSFSKGKFQAEELRQQLGEAIPGIVPRFMQAVAKMNEGTALAGKSFDKLLQDGDLNVKKYLPAMIEALRQTGSGAEEAAKGLNAELNRLSTAWFKLKADASGGVFSDAAISSVRLMAENLDKVAGAATIAAGVIAGRLVGAGARTAYSAVSAPISDRAAAARQATEMTGLARERVKEAAAQVEQARASVRLVTTWQAQTAAGQDTARSQLAVAAAAHEAAQRTLEHQAGAATLSANLRAQREAQAASVVAQRNLARAQVEYNAAVASGNRADAAAVTAKGRLIIAQEAAAVATNNLVLARAKETVTGAASSLGGMVTSGLKSAGTGVLALAGGPWGVAAIAIGGMGIAYANMVREAEAAREEYKQQIKSLGTLSYTIDDTISQLNRMEGANPLRKAAESWYTIGESIKGADEKIAKLQEKIQGLKDLQKLQGWPFSLEWNDDIAEAQAQIVSLQATVGPSKQKFHELESTLKKTLDPEIFRKLKSAAESLNEADFAAFSAKIKGLGVDVRDVLHQIDAAGQGDIWSRQIARLKREQGEYQAWLATEAKKYMDAFGTTSASAAFDQLKTQNPVEYKSFQERAKFVREDVAAEKAWNDQQKANKASARESISDAKQQESGYQSLIESIKKRIEQDKEALLYADRMTEAERMGAKARADSNYGKATKDQKAYLDGLIKAAEEAGRAARAHEQMNAALRETADLRQQQRQEYSSKVASDSLDVASLGMTSIEAERARRAVDEQLRYQREMDSIRSRYDDREQTAALAAEMDKQLSDAKAHHDRMVAEEEDYQSRVDRARADWAQGAAVAFKEYQEAAADTSKQTYDVLSKVFSGLEDSIVNFVKTGKLSFTDLANSILEDLARIAAKKMIAGVVGSIAGGGGTTGTLADLFSGSWGFDKGGWTGPGGKHEVAGLVHRDEGVLNKEEMAALGGPGGFYALRHAIRNGYADGGVVSGSQLIRVPSYGEQPRYRGGAGGRQLQQNLTVQVAGRPDRRTPDQIARATARETSRAMARA
jgi:lambda family phage tail tape measure protein